MSPRKFIAGLALLSLATMAFAVQPDLGRARKSFKGIELYSWKGSTGNWRFALLPGTNRLKTEAEIKKGKNAVSSVHELRKRFLKLSKGEQVFWSSPHSGGFTYPDETIKAEILAAAKEAGIDLHVP